MTKEFLFEQNTKYKSKDTTDKFYTSIKDYDFIDQDNNPRSKNENDSRVMAKIKCRLNNSFKYLIRLNNIKQFYNPLTPLPENQKNKLLNQDGGDEIQFKEVSRSVFDMYTTFLRTMNSIWIRNAEREGF
jgi:hypothetical protein